MANQNISLPTNNNSVPFAILEPLAESAPLALDWSKSLCDGCGSYHGAWQVLRLLGVMNSMRSDDDFLLPQLAGLIGEGARSILVSGAADYAFLARILAASGARANSLEITVADRCETPLELNRWYAHRAGLEIATWRGEILQYDNPGAFDLVCTHSFFGFFNARGRKALVTSWWDCLASGGAVLTAQRTRPHDPDSRHGFSRSQSDNLGARAFRLAEDRFEQLGIDPGYARSLAVAYASDRESYTIRDEGHLRRIFLEQGFELEHFAPPDRNQAEKDIPSVPTAPSTFRWRILARKPPGQNSR